MVSYLTSFKSNIVSVAIFKIFDIPLPVSRTCVFRISTKNNRYPQLPGLYLGGKFGEDRWMICDPLSVQLVSCDRLTD